MLLVTDKLELHVLSKTSRKTITTVLNPTGIGEGSFRIRPLERSVNDSGYVAWQPEGEAQDKFIQTLVGGKGTRTNISDEVLTVAFVQDSQDVQRIGALHYFLKFFKEKEVSFSHGPECLALTPDDVITISNPLYGGTYDVLIDSMHIRQDGSIDFTCIKFREDMEDWEDLSPSAITVYEDDTTKYWSPPTAGPLTAQNLGVQGFDVWGHPYLTVSPIPNVGQYTSIQAALNALGESRSQGIMLLNGTHTLTAPIYLPDRDLELMGESHGAIVTNAPGHGAFKLLSLTKHITLRGFSITSGTTSGGTELIRVSGSSAALHVTLSNLNFTAYDDGTSGDECISFDNTGAGTVVVDGCVSVGGSKFLLLGAQSTFPGVAKILNNTISGTVFRAMSVPAGTTVIMGNTLSDIIGDGIAAGGSSSGTVTVSGNTISYDSATDGILDDALAIQGDHATCEGNSIVYVSATTGITVYGIVIENVGFARVANNGIRIAGTGSGLSAVGAYLGTGAENCVFTGNVIKVDASVSGYWNYGVMLINGASYNVIGANRIDMCHDAGGGSDVGIYVTAGCTDNSGLDNILTNCSTELSIYGTDNNINGIDCGAY